MKAKILSTVSEKLQGVIGRDDLDEDEVYIFKNIEPSQSFHMRSVPFPLEIAFVDQDCSILDIKEMQAEEGTAKAPENTVLAVEASKGYFERNKLKVGDFWKEIHNRISVKST